MPIWPSLHAKWIASTEPALDLVGMLVAVFPDEVHDDHSCVKESIEIMDYFRATLQNWVTPKWALLPNIRDITLTPEQTKRFIEIGNGPTPPLPSGRLPISMSREEFLRLTGRG